MTEENGTQEVVTPEEPTEQQLMAAMNKAVKSGDFKQVAKIATEIAKVQKSKEQAELEAKQKELEAKTDSVQKAIIAAIQPFYDAGELDKADGVWFTWDFGEKLTACRLMKAAAKAKTGGGGGGGKKFAVSTADLLTKYGSEEYKDGVSYQQSWDSNTDKNHRYAIRESLLKKDGIIQ